MATIEEARKQLAEQRQKIQEYQEKLRSQKSQLSVQGSLRKGGLSELQQRKGVKQNIQQQEQALTQSLQEITGYEQEVSKAEAEYNAQIQKQQELQAQVRIVERIMAGELPRSLLSQFPREVIAMVGGQREALQSTGVSVPPEIPQYQVTLPSEFTSTGFKTYLGTEEQVKKIASDYQYLTEIDSSLLKNPKKISVQPQNVIIQPTDDWKPKPLSIRETIFAVGEGIGNVLLRGRPYLEAFPVKYYDTKIPANAIPTLTLAPSGKGSTTVYVTPEGTKYDYKGNILDKYGNVDKIATKEIATKTFNKPSEYYDAKINMYVSQSPTGRQGTSYMRPPTPVEQEKINKIKGNNILYLTKGDIEIKQKAQKVYENIVSLGSDLSKLKEGNVDVKTGEWIGTEQDYKKYSEKFAEYELLTQKFSSLGGSVTDEGINAPTIKAGLFGLTKEYPFSGIINEETPISNVGNILGVTGSGFFGSGLERGVRIVGGGEESVKAFGYLGEQVGGAVPFLNPIGTTIYFAGVGERAGLSVKKEGVGGIWTYAKENPADVIAIATLGFLKGYEKYKELKFARYLETIQKESLLENVKMSANVMTDIREVPKTTLSIPNILDFKKDINLNIRTKVKGVTTTTEYYPSLDFAGKVSEITKAGKGEGIVYQGEKGFFEAIDLGKYVKVTKVSKTGEGVVQLFDKRGNLVFQTKTQPSLFGTGNVENLPEEKIVFDINQPNPYQITKKIERRGGKVREEISVNLKTGERVVNPFDVNYQPELTSSKTTGEINIKTKKTTYPEGVTNIQMDKSLFSDVIQSTERKSSVQLKAKEGSIIIKKRTGQEIQYGRDLEIDRTLRTELGGNQLIQKKISPNVNRELTEASGTSIIQIYKNPKYYNPSKVEIPQWQKDLEKRINKLNLESKIREVERFAEQLKGKAKVEISKGGEVKITPIESNYPSYTGGTNIGEQLGFEFQESVYVQPVEELLKGGQVPEVNLQMVTPVFEKSAQTLFVKPTTIQEQIRTQELEPLTLQLRKEKVLIKELPKELLLQPLGQVQKQQPVQKEIQLLKQLLTTKQKYAQKQQLIQKQEQQPRQIQQQREFIPIVFPSLTKGGKKVSAKEVLSDMFQVFKRTKGKDIYTGEEVSLGKATESLRKQLKGGLEASGFIISKKTGKKVPFEQIAFNLGGEFRPAKKDIFRIVQKKERRLGTRIEVTKIQSAKKQKQGKIKWL